MPTAPPSQGGPSPLEHLGVVLSFAGVAFTLVAVLGLAKFDLTTALGIIDTVGPVHVLVQGVVITSLPLVAVLAVEASMVLPRPQLWFSRNPKAFGVFVGGGILLYAAIPWPIALLASGVTAAGFLGVLRCQSN